MLTRESCCDALQRDTAVLATFAKRDLERAVPSCPGWSVASLVTHLTADVYAPRIRLLEAAPRDIAIESYSDLCLPDRFEQWIASKRNDFALLPDGLVALFEATSARLVTLLRAADPQLPVRTFWRPQQHAGFLQRRMALETAMHRWDVEHAFGQEQPIAMALAADGVDEALEIMLPSSRKRDGAARPGEGEAYHLHQTDGPGEWLIRFNPDGPIVTREHAKGDVAIRGSASDLFLFLWHRIPASRLELFGEKLLAERYVEFAPPL